MKILLFGSNGFVGNSLSKFLESEGYDIFRSDINIKSENSNNYACDVTNFKEVSKLVKEIKPGLCINLAAITGHAKNWNKLLLSSKVNCYSVINILKSIEQLSKSTRFIYFSSSAVYNLNNSGKLIGEESEFSPQSVYGNQKYFADTFVSQFSEKYNIHANIVRPSNIIGRGQSGNFVIPDLVSSLRDIKYGKARNKVFVGNLKIKRDFVDILDVNSAIKLIIENSKSNETFNICTSRQHSIGDILAELSKILNVNPEVILDEKKFSNEFIITNMSHSKIKKMFGWKPKVKLEESLKIICR